MFSRLPIIVMAISCVVLAGCNVTRVPSVVGMTQEEAGNEIVGVGLTVGSVTQDYSNSVAEDRVISQNPVVNTTVSPGSPVDLVISLGPSQVTVPNVVGMTQALASSTLAAANLSVGTITQQPSVTVAKGSVISQDPAANSTASPHTAVDLVVSMGLSPILGWTYIPDQVGIWLRSVSLTSPDSPSVERGFIISGGHEGADVPYVLKLTSGGSKVWDNTYSKTDPDTSTNFWPNATSGVVQRADGAYVAVTRGYKELNDPLPEDSYLQLLINPNGSLSGSAEYAPYVPGSTTVYAGMNVSAALALTSDNGTVIFGSSNVSDYPVASILKTDHKGHADLVKVINDNGGAYDEQMTGGQVTLDSGYVMSGYSGEFGQDYALLIKLDSDGVLQWSKKYQDLTNKRGAAACCVTQTASDEGYAFGGQILGDLTKISTYGGFLAKADSNGHLVWFRSLADVIAANYLTCIAETPQGDLVVGGTDVLNLAKFDSTGNLLWEFQDSSLPNGSVNALVLTDDGGCVVVGSDGEGSSIVFKVNNVYSVEPAPTVTAWPAATSITISETLASSTLTGGAASVAGTFAFLYPNAQSGSGTSHFDVVFTPDDIAHYRPVYGTVPVVVTTSK